MSLLVVGSLVVGGLLIITLILCAMAIEGTKEISDDSPPEPKQLSFWDWENP